MNSKKKKTSLVNLQKYQFLLILPVIIGLNCRLEMDLQKQVEPVQPGINPDRVWDTYYWNRRYKTADFNGDGYEDEIEPIDYYEVNSVLGAGIVRIHYGNNAIADQDWHQDSPGILGGCEPYDLFGWNAEPGDFNGDGYDDLAIGVVNESINVILNAGCVNVIYGSANGLTAAGNQLWNQNTSGIQGACEEDDSFGYNLVAADFNGDGYTDLVIGVPYESIGSIVRAGAIHLLLGSENGLTAAGNQMWYLDINGTPNQSQEHMFFGTYMMAGKFHSTDYCDLVVGVPRTEVNNTNYAGAIYYFPGCSTGLTATGSQEWTAASAGIDTEAIYEGYFGRILLAGYFTNIPGNGLQDLAIGYPDATVNNQAEAGEVYVLFGTAQTGFQSDKIRKFNRNTYGISGVPTQGDHFGMHLNSGQYDSGAYEDILVKCDILNDAYLYGYKGSMSGTPF